MPLCHIQQSDEKKKIGPLAMHLIITHQSNKYVAHLEQMLASCQFLRFGRE